MTETVIELVEWIDRERHHHHHHFDRRRFTLMTTQANPFVLTGTAQYPDPKNPGQFLNDPNAKGVWTEDSGGVACTLDDQGTVDGVSTLGVTPSTTLESDTVVTITGYAVDPDEHATPTDTYVFTVPAAVVVPPDTDATQFVISDGSGAATGTAQSAAAPVAPIVEGVPPTAEQINAVEAAAAAAPAEVAPIVEGVPPTAEQIDAAEAAAAAAAAPADEGTAT